LLRLIEILNCVEALRRNFSRPYSRGGRSFISSATQERLCQEKEASENEEYSSSKALLQTTHADDIFKVYLAMERWFKDHLALRVRAESAQDRG